MRINTDRESYYGIGDLVTLAWIAEGTRETDDPISFHAKPGLKYNVLELLGQTVAHVPEDPGICVSQAYENELKDRGRRPRVDYIRELLGRKTPLARPKIRFSARDFEWGQKTRKDLGAEDLVVMFPQTKWLPQDWPPCHWCDLAWQLNERGIKPAMMLSHEDKRYTNTPMYYWGFSLAGVASLVSTASLVVAVDNGPAYLAATLGVPTIVLAGPTRPQCAFAHLPEVMPLTSQGGPDCAGCHYSGAFRPACKAGCQMLYALRPHMALGKIIGELALIRRSPAGKPRSFSVKDGDAA